MKIYLTFVLLFTAVCVNGQQARLTLRLKKDSVYYLNTNVAMTTNQYFPGKKTMAGVQISSLSSHKVTDVLDTAYRLEVQFERLSVKINIDGLILNEMPDMSGTLTELASLMKHKVFHIVVSRYGSLMAVEDADKLFNSSFDSVSNLSDQKKLQLLTAVRSLFDKRVIRNTYFDAFTLVPKDAVDLNYSWTVNQNLESSVRATMDTKYFLSAVNNNVCVITGEGTLRAGPSPDYRSSNGLMMRMIDVGGTIKKKIVINSNTGWPVNISVVRNLKATGDIKDCPQFPGGLKFPVEMLFNISSSTR
ncbi:hypothetical protein DYU05_16745 [Mucilaginibacter terrenus]|uniref:Uncharacterized protein n=1 Tax=Mucilaginibacter terrenus TaxID=2482727 RepID=A0A3E2NMR8_9SPHI|nr:DUF6263 family protein [Mucilaginibacter terrenus]RFZ82261.1 hypothetical protein DYU05_16745 [Mucilaginibacter terrenus]